MAAIHVGVTCWPRRQPSEVRDVIHFDVCGGQSIFQTLKVIQAGFDMAKLRERKRLSLILAAARRRLSNFLC